MRFCSACGKYLDESHFYKKYGHCKECCKLKITFWDRRAYEEGRYQDLIPYNYFWYLAIYENKIKEPEIKIPPSVKKYIESTTKS